MEMDEFKLDPQVLESTADLIVQYCMKQRAVMDDYLQSVSALHLEWDDDETFGRVIQEIRTLHKSVGDVMDMIRFKYPQYFKQLAKNIRERPKFNN